MLENFATILLHARVLVKNITGFWHEEFDLFAKSKNILSKRFREN